MAKRQAKSEKAVMSQCFDHQRYVVVRSFLEPSICSFAYQYALKKAELGKMTEDDGQVPGSSAAYGDALMEMLMEEIRPQVESIIGLSLFPTYAFFRVYRRGNILKKHTDRPSCEISLTLNLGSEDSTPWPIYMQGPLGVAEVQLGSGDGVIYRGCEVFHWRNPFEGLSQVQVFFHYINQHGPYLEWKFDQRPRLSAYQGNNLFQLLKARSTKKV